MSDGYKSLSARRRVPLARAPAPARKPRRRTSYLRSAKSKVVWEPVTPYGCGARTNAYWPVSTGTMRKSLSAYSAAARPYNRRRINQTVAKYAFEMPSKAGRHNLCNLTYKLATDKPTGSATVFSLPTRYVPRRTSLLRAAPKPRKCKASSVQCGSRCIKKSRKCHTVYSASKKRYLVPGYEMD
jgi:hypothetical protein